MAFGKSAVILGFLLAFSLENQAFGQNRTMGQIPWSEDVPRVITPSEPEPNEKARRQSLDLYLHGLIDLNDKRPVEAIGFLEKALESDPKALAPRQALVWAHNQLYRRDEVIRLGREVLEQQPDDISLALTVASSLELRGREAEAGDLLERLLKSEKVHDSLSMRLDVLGQVANLRRDTRRWKESEVALRELVGLLDRPELTVLGWSAGRLKDWKVEALERIGRLRVEQNDMEGALAGYREARAVDPMGCARLGLLLGQVLARQGRLKEAMEKLGEYLATRPNTLEGYELWTILRRQQGQDQQLLRDLTQFTEADPLNTSLGLLLARQRALLGDMLGAEAACLKALRAHPDDESARLLVELWWIQPGKGPAAVLEFLDSCIEDAGTGPGGGIPAFPGQTNDKTQGRHLALVLRQDPVRLRELIAFATSRLTVAGEAGAPGSRLEKPKAGAITVPWKPVTLQMLGRWALDLRLFPEAVALNRALLSIRGSEQDIRFVGRITLAEVLVEDFRLEEASRVVREALAEAKPGPERLHTRLWLAAILSQMKEHERALEQVDLAEVEAPEHLVAKCQGGRAKVVAEAGRPEEALLILAKLREKLLGLEDRRTVALTAFYILGKLKRLEDADKELEALLGIDPNDAGVCNALSFSWSERNVRLDEAERLIRRCLQNEEVDESQGKRGGDRGGWSPHPSASYVDTLGWVLFRQGRLDQALRELDRALALPGGDDPEIWEHRGDVLAAMGRQVEAVSTWRRALSQLESNPHHPKGDRRGDLIGKLRAEGPVIPAVKP